VPPPTPNTNTARALSRENTLWIARPSQPLPFPQTCRVKAALQPTHTPLRRSGFQRTWSTIGDAAWADGGSFPQPPPCTEAKRIGRGVVSAGWRVLCARVAAERTQAGVCSHPSQASGARQTPAPQRPSAARASPGSKVQSNRGAVREMQLRFLSTLLRMVPTPPPPWRLRHRPPRRREPVSLSCRIRQRRPPPGCSLLLRLRLRRRNDSSRRARRVQAGEAPWRVASAQPELRESRGSEKAAELRETGWHLQCGARTAENGAGWGGEEGGSERAGTQRRRRRLGTQSRHQPEQQGGLSPGAPEPRSQLRGQKPETRQKYPHV
jgi:hypothetical protein